MAPIKRPMHEYGERHAAIRTAPRPGYGLVDEDWLGSAHAAAGARQHDETTTRCVTSKRQIAHEMVSAGVTKQKPQKPSDGSLVQKGLDETIADFEGYTKSFDDEAVAKDYAIKQKKQEHMG